MVGIKFAFLRGNLINSFVREYILKSCRRQTSSMCFVLERARKFAFALINMHYLSVKISESELVQFVARKGR